MSFSRDTKTEHAGPRNRGRTSGYWGRRQEAKHVSRRLRRRRGREAVRHALAAHDG